MQRRHSYAPVQNQQPVTHGQRRGSTGSAGVRGGSPAPSPGGTPGRSIRDRWFKLSRGDTPSNNESSVIAGSPGANGRGLLKGGRFHQESPASAASRGWRKNIENPANIICFASNFCQKSRRISIIINYFKKIMKICSRS